MAKLKNLEKIWQAPQGVPVTVGHNRTIENESPPDQPPRFVCRLHGHPIARIAPLGKTGAALVTLRHCGFMTATTRQAVGDFCRAFGIQAGISFARGQFSVRYADSSGITREKCDSEQAGKIHFVAARYPVEKDS